MKIIDDIKDAMCADIDIPDKPPSETLLLVAMSGGVDSSTIAALLKIIGYKVIGITLNLYSGNDNSCAKEKSCCGSRDVRDARAVADKFDFPHYVLDYREKFQKSVIDKFIQNYTSGMTPIPCILCNQSVKFDDLLNLSQSIGADALVTGHYARRRRINGTPFMMEALDASKDQSYFLGFTTRSQLNYIRFPLGNLYKQRTREIAQNIGIAIHDKPDSQDICFVGKGSYRDFIPDKPGQILDLSGKQVGTHNGIHNFTIGQRRGLHSSFNHDAPLYVVEINSESNTLIIGPRERLMSDICIIEEVIWNAQPLPGEEINVRLRSTQDKSLATIIECCNESANIRLAEPHFAIAPGQACIFYNKNVVIGAGIIKNSYSSPS